MGEPSQEDEMVPTGSDWCLCRGAHRASAPAAEVPAGRAQGTESAGKEEIPSPSCTPTGLNISVGQKQSTISETPATVGASRSLALVIFLSKG